MTDVRMPNRVTLRFPSGTPQSTMTRVARQYWHKQTTPAPSFGQRIRKDLVRGAEATAAGLAAPIVGANQRIDAVAGAIPGLGFLRRGANRAARVDARYAAKAPAVSFAANTLNPLYLALPEARAAGLGEALGRGAVAGTIAGAAQPTRSPRAALANTAAGAVLGPAAGLVARGSEALGRSLPGQLARAGVRISTPDMLPEQWAVNLHKLLGILPGRFADAAQQGRALKDYQTKVVYPWVLRPIGRALGKGVEAGREGWREVRAAAKDEYDRVLGNRDVLLPTAGVLSPPWLAGDPGVQAAGAINAMGLGHIFRALDDTAQSRVLDAVEKELIEPLHSVLTTGGTVPARALKNAQSDLRDTASRLLRSDDQHLRGAGAALSRVASGLTDTIAEANPKLASDLRDADATWHRVALVEDAMPRKAEVKGKDEAIVSPRAILDAMRGSDATARHGRWIEGTLPDQPMFEGHRRVLNEPREPGLLGFSIGTGALLGGGSALANPALAGAVGIGSALPFTRTGSALARALGYSPNIEAALARSPAPVASAASRRN